MKNGNYPSEYFWNWIHIHKPLPSQDYKRFLEITRQKFAHKNAPCRKAFKIWRESAATLPGNIYTTVIKTIAQLWETVSDEEIANTIILHTFQKAYQECEPDPFVEGILEITDILRRETVMATVTTPTEFGTFAQDNYANLLLFIHQNYAEKEGCMSLILRKFEDGPKEPISNLPYKTLCGARIDDGIWTFLSEEEMKYAHTTDAETGNPLTVQAGILFSSIEETYPNLFEKIKALQPNEK
jgi:hypothetical protein